jgi:hypothetical protein
VDDQEKQNNRRRFDDSLIYSPQLRRRGSAPNPTHSMHQPSEINYRECKTGQAGLKPKLQQIVVSMIYVRGANVAWLLEHLVDWNECAET